MLPTDRFIAYLPLAHILELLAENLMLIMGVAIGYSSTLTLTDTGTMVAKGCKVELVRRKQLLVLDSYS